ncbi:hypothetical protein C5167_007126, partial [Papaver somniferum]
GLQRFCSEHKIKLSKVNICGPPGLKCLIDAISTFVPNNAVLHTHIIGSTSTSNGGAIFDSEILEEPTTSTSNGAPIFDSNRLFKEPIAIFADEVVKISALLLRPSCSPPSNPSFLKPLASHSQNLDRAKLKPGDISVIYVVELSEIIGKFDPNKAMKLGLKRGSKFRDLQLGQSVQSDYQNITVHPSDVMGPSVAGPIVLLVDCPTLSHLQQMVSLQSLSSYFDGVKIVSCVVHLSPSSVALTAEYQTWMRRFGGAQHIMAGHEKKKWRSQF